MDWTAIWLTVKLATCTTAILFVLGLPLAWWTARTKSRLRIFIEAIIAMPIILPPTVVGFYFLVVMGARSPIGRSYESIVGEQFAFSFAGILIASVLYNLPFAVRPFATAFEAVDRRLLEASWCLGVSKFASFWRVAFPLSRAGVLSGIVLTFAHTVGEFGVVLMVGGDIAGQTRTVSIAVYDHLQFMQYAEAHETSLLLVVFSFVTLCCTYALQRRRAVVP